MNVNEIYSNLRSIKAGIRLSIMYVLGPVLYTIYKIDMPTVDIITIATYVDDTTVLTSHESPSIASNLVQTKQILFKIANLGTWNIKLNSRKSVHVTLALRKNICPPMYWKEINGNATVIPRNVFIFI